MDLVFFRSKTISVKTNEPGEPRAFVFDVTLGVGSNLVGLVDPLSGMAADLTAVDGVLQEIQTELEVKCWTGIGEAFAEGLRIAIAAAPMKTMVLRELVFTEKRGTIIGWRDSRPFWGKKDLTEFSGELYGISYQFAGNLPEEAKRAVLIQSLAEIQSGSVFSDFENLIQIELDHFASGSKKTYRV